MRLYDKVLGFVRSRNTKCLWVLDKRLDGQYDRALRQIEVNPKSEIVNVICHEALHGLFPKLSEEAVIRTADNLTQRLTRKQSVLLINAFVRKAAKRRY